MAMASATAVPMAATDPEKDAVIEDTATKAVPKGALSEKLLKHSHDVDAAMKAFEGMEGQVITLTEEKSKALLRKIDWHLMPVGVLCCPHVTWAGFHCVIANAVQIMCVVYGLNYLDKTTLSYASIMGLKLPPSSDPLHSGIGLTGDQYSWLGSMFYFGYIAWEYPTSRLLQVLPLGKYCKYHVYFFIPPTEKERDQRKKKRQVLAN